MIGWLLVAAAIVFGADDKVVVRERLEPQSFGPTLREAPAYARPPEKELALSKGAAAALKKLDQIEAKIEKAEAEAQDRLITPRYNAVVKLAKAIKAMKKRTAATEHLYAVLLTEVRDEKGFAENELEQALERGIAVAEGEQKVKLLMMLAWYTDDPKPYHAALAGGAGRYEGEIHARLAQMALDQKRPDDAVKEFEAAKGFPSHRRYAWYWFGWEAVRALDCAGVARAAVELRKDNDAWVKEGVVYDLAYDDLTEVEAACVRWHGYSRDALKKTDPFGAAAIDKFLTYWDKERPVPADAKGKIADAVGRCWVDVIRATKALDGGATMTLSGDAKSPTLAVEGKWKKEWGKDAELQKCVSGRLGRAKLSGGVSGTLVIDWNRPSL